MMRAASGERPNILLVVLDAARRDALEPYGAAPGSSPAVAQLASRGAGLPEVYATGCWTVPSHASIFTGLMPRAAGLAQVVSTHAAKPIVRSHRGRMLPEVLGRAGYSTATLSANVWVSPASGFDTGFDEIPPVATNRHGRLDGGSRRDRLRWLAHAARGRADDGARAIGRTLERWVAEPERRPFLWYVNLLECHSPYLPPRGYGDVSARDRVRAADEARRHYTLDAIWRACVGGFDMPDETIELMRRMYAGSIRYMDDWLARLLDRLDAARILDDTLVVVFSDHGENLGEGGLIAHAFSLDDRLIHVPFVLAGPGAEAASVTSLAGLPALVAQTAGLDQHPWSDGPPHGVGVAQFDPPGEAGDPRVREAIERWGLGEDALRRFTTPLSAAVAGDLKLVVNGEREEAYDLTADPLERSPLDPTTLGAERAGALSRLRAALSHPAMTARHAGTTAPAEAPTADELQDIEERMRLLGYM